MEYGLTKEYAQNVPLRANPLLRHLEVGVDLFDPYMTAGYTVVVDKNEYDPGQHILLHRPWYTLGILGRYALIQVAAELEERLGPSEEQAE